VRLDMQTYVRQLRLRWEKSVPRRRWCRHRATRWRVQRV